MGVQGLWVLLNASEGLVTKLEVRLLDHLASRLEAKAGRQAISFLHDDCAYKQ